MSIAKIPMNVELIQIIKFIFDNLWITLIIIVHLYFLINFLLTLLIEDKKLISTNAFTPTKAIYEFANKNLSQTKVNIERTPHQIFFDLSKNTLYIDSTFAQSNRIEDLILVSRYMFCNISKWIKYEQFINYLLKILWFGLTALICSNILGLNLVSDKYWLIYLTIFSLIVSYDQMKRMGFRKKLGEILTNEGVIESFEIDYMNQILLKWQFSNCEFYFSPIIDLV